MALLVNNNGTWFTYLGRKDGKIVRASTQIPVTAKTKALTKENKLAAEAIASRLRLEYRLNRYGLTTEPTGEAPTFRAFAEEWETQWGAVQRGYEGRVSYRVKALIAQFGDYRIDQLTPDVVVKWRTARLKAKVSAGTINRDVDELKSILAKGVPRYYVDSPLRRMPRLKAAPATATTLSPEHEKTILEGLDPEDKAIFLVALDSLVRLGDVLALKWEDVAGGMARVRYSKSGKAYAVPLSKRAQAAVEALRPAQVDPQGWVFVSACETSASEKQRTDSYIARLRRLCKKLNVPYGRRKGGVTFHAATRHTGATRLVEAGVDLRTVQEIGGWATMAMLSRYVHPATETLRAAVEKIGPAVST